ncbi:MAG TPA: dienelactone hydrolase family protein [Methanoregula sp.]|nr:dienelactone hydrolase family protein [Methanoregula sp.]
MNRSLLSSAIFCLLVLAAFAAGCTNAKQANTTPLPSSVTGSMISITADQKTYPAYISVPTFTGKHPGIILLHSFNGLEPGYKVMCDRMATDGFVVIAPEWQTFDRQAGDPEVGAVVRSSIAALKTREDVDAQKLGLIGFCAWRRFTMLFLPQFKDFGAGVAFYGFPYSRGNTNTTTPAGHIGELSTPILVIHGFRDQASPISGIYNYTKELDAADKYYELKVYQGKPHGFMIVNGTFGQDTAAKDAYSEMTGFFRRMLE